MKRILGLLVVFVLVIGMLPVALGINVEIGIDGSVTVVEEDCEAAPPTIYVDPTARIWEPNDETWYTADYYGEPITNKHGVGGYVNAKRGNYVFEGETLKYFVIVENENGPEDIHHVALFLSGSPVGQCLKVEDFSDTSSFGPSFSGYDTATMASYICTLIVDGAMNGDLLLEVRASTGEVCLCDPPGLPPPDDCTDPPGPYTRPINNLDADEIMAFNPLVSIALTGSIDFGTATPGSVAATTDSVILENDGEVIIDTYIAASDYFTDDTNPWAICGDGNGIPYWAFSYYAMKGTINSGLNDNSAYGLGETVNDPNIEGDICTTAEDEYTTIPSNSGRIDDMCRIINWDEDASLLGAGDTMSILFQLDVPTPCVGSFTDGQFYFVGEVV